MEATSDLIGMKNLGRTMVLWLNAVGVHSRADLERRGVINVYRAMRERRFRATRVALFSLHGALQDRPWRQLSEDEKARLVAEAEAAGDLVDDYAQAAS